MINVCALLIDLHICQSIAEVPCPSELRCDDSLAGLVYIAESDSLTSRRQPFGKSSHRVVHAWNCQSALGVYESPFVFFANRGQTFVKSLCMIEFRCHYINASRVD